MAETTIVIGNDGVTKDGRDSVFADVFHVESLLPPTHCSCDQITKLPSVRIQTVD